MRAVRLMNIVQLSEIPPAQGSVSGCIKTIEAMIDEIERLRKQLADVEYGSDRAMINEYERK